MLVDTLDCLQLEWHALRYWTPIGRVEAMYRRRTANTNTENWINFKEINKITRLDKHLSTTTKNKTWELMSSIQVRFGEKVKFFGKFESIRTFNASAMKKLCWTSSFCGFSTYTFLIPLKPPDDRQCFSMACIASQPHSRYFGSFVTRHRIK